VLWRTNWPLHRRMPTRLSEGAQPGDPQAPCGRRAGVLAPAGLECVGGAVSSARREQLALMMRISGLKWG